MTQEEKLEEAKRLYETANADQRYVLESLFPELKESEDVDEMIRKQLLKHLKDVAAGKSLELSTTDYERWATWVEKQGDHANFLSRIQVGDRVTRNEDGVLVNLSQLNRVAKKLGEQKPQRMVSAEAKEALYDKPAWSKQDILMKGEIINVLQKTGNYEKEINWLKSLRPQSRWKPSESDILLLERIANGKSNPQDFQASLGGLIGQLKKLSEE